MHNPFKQPPVLRFSVYAWAKLMYMRSDNHEVGCLATSLPTDPLLVTDLTFIKQLVSGASFEFDDNAVAEYVDNAVASGLQPADVFRIWVHTHPGSSASPSRQDEETFEELFGDCDWAIMFILDEDNDQSTRLHLNHPASGSYVIPATIDWSAPFPPANHEAWAAERKANIHVKPPSKHFAANAAANNKAPGVSGRLPHLHGSRRTPIVTSSSMLDEIPDDWWEYGWDDQWEDQKEDQKEDQNEDQNEVTLASRDDSDDENALLRWWEKCQEAGIELTESQLQAAQAHYMNGGRYADPSPSQ